MGKNKEEVKKGAPAWMTTFSDLVTLLLTFFVLLLSFANTDLIKYKEAVGSLKEAFGVQTKEIADFPTQSSDPLSLDISAPKPFTIIEQETTRGARSQTDLDTKENKDYESKENLAYDELEKDLKNFIMDEGLQGELGLSVESGKVTLRAISQVMFAPGSAKVINFSVLDKISYLLKVKHSFKISIEGYTDNTPSGSGYPSNWELAAIRATTVLRYLVQSGISENRLRAISYGKTKPYVPNTNSSNRKKNRRVEFVFTQGVWE